ncbi:MAG TPA: methyltransferase domain-containing protein [Clostridia bacterium]|nr:methyltransferase domain-containing protein [Clostridia bacterium]
MSTPIFPYICPLCNKTLAYNGKSYVCPNKHLFDVSKSGYVNLLPVNKKNSINPGDNKEMINARVAVMDSGYYKSLADCIIDLLAVYAPKSILDAGCGIGYLTNRLHQAFPSSQLLGTDISKYAINSASKQYKDIPFAVASSNSFPIESESVDAIVCAFAPVFSEEFLRILTARGVFVRVIPGAKHLLNLKAKLYDNPTLNEPDAEEIEGFDFIKSVTVVDTFNAKNNAELVSLVQMTPYFYHVKKSSLDVLSLIPSLIVGQEFDVRLYIHK